MSGSLKAAGSGLSRAWSVATKHVPAFTGGKVQVNGEEDFLACMYGQNVSFMDVQSGLVTGRLHAEDDETAESITCFVLHPNSKELVTASMNQLLRHWQLETKECVRSIRAHDLPIQAMDYDPTGTLVTTGSSDTTVRVFDIPRGYCTHVFRMHRGVVSTVKFHPDPRRLMVVSCSEDSTVCCWDLTQQTCVGQFTSHMSVPTSISFFANGNVMATAGRDKVISFYDLNSYTSVKTVAAFESLEGVVALTPELSAAVFEHLHVALPKSAKKKGDAASEQIAVLTCGEKGDLKVYRAQLSGEVDVALVAEIPIIQYKSAKTPVVLVQLHWLQRSNQLMFVTSDHNFLLYDLPSLQRSRQVVGFNDDILDIKYVPTVREVDDTETVVNERVVVATNSPQVRVFNLAGFSCVPLDGHEDIVLAVDASPDGQWIFSSSKDKTCRVWRVRDGLCVGFAPGHADAIGAIGCSKRRGPFKTHGAYFASASSDKTLKLWRLNINELSNTTEMLTLESENSVRAHDKDINAVTVSPNDALVATGSQDKTIKLWRSSDLSHVGTLNGHKRGIWKIEFSTVDKCLASCSGDRTVKLWSVVDFTCLRTFQGHTGSVLAVQFVNHGMQLMSSSSDGLVKLWTIRTGECENTFDVHADKVWTLAVDAPNKRFVSGGSDSAICIWEDTTEQEEEAAIKAAEESLLKEQEMGNYLMQKQYKKALHLALDLNHSQRVFNILREVLEGTGRYGDEDQRPPAPEVALDDFIRDWSDDELTKIVAYVKDWNTNAKFAFVAQTVLNRVLRVLPPAKLTALRAVYEANAALIAYTDRHFQRLDRLYQASFLTDMTLSSMRLLEAAGSLDETALADRPAMRMLHEQRRKAAMPLRPDNEEDEEEEVPIVIPFDEDYSSDSDAGRPIRAVKPATAKASSNAAKTQSKRAQGDGDDLDDLEDYILPPGRDKHRAYSSSEEDDEEIILYPDQIMLVDDGTENHPKRLSAVSAARESDDSESDDGFEKAPKSRSSSKRPVSGGRAQRGRGGRGAGRGRGAPARKRVRGGN